MSYRRTYFQHLPSLSRSSYRSLHELWCPDKLADPNIEHFRWHIGVGGSSGHDLDSSAQAIADGWMNRSGADATPGQGPAGVEWTDAGWTDTGRLFLAFHREFIRDLEDFIGRGIPRGTYGFTSPEMALVPLPSLSTGLAVPAEIEGGAAPAATTLYSRPSWTRDDIPTNPGETRPEEYTSLRQFRSSIDLGYHIAKD